MKIGITGAKGFIGEHCIEYLKKFYEVVGLYRENTQKIGHEIPEIEYRSTSYKGQSLHESLMDCDAIIHLAAKKVVPSEPNGIAEYFENLSTLENVIKTAQSLKITNIVTISSRCVYGNHTETTYSENDPLFPINFYALEKIMEEKLCKYYNDNYNMNIKILRLSQVISDNINDKNIFSVFIRQALHNQPLSLYGKGIATRDYIYIKDVCIGIKNAITQKEKRGIYNFASGKGVNLEKLAELIVTKCHSNSSIIHIEPITEDTSRIILNPEKMKNELNFECKYTVEKIIDDITRNYSNENS